MNALRERRSSTSPGTERGVWCLLLQLGAPARTYGKDPARHFRIAQKELKPLQVVIRPVGLGSEVDLGGRYLFRFRRYKRDDAAAIRLAEAFLYGMSLVHGPVIEDHHDSLVFPIPDCIVRGESVIRIDALAELARSRPPEDRFLEFPRTTLSSFSCTTGELHEAAWRIVAVTFNDEALFDATRFLKRSHDNFYVYPGQIREVARDRESSARTSSQQTHFEDALQNAFKAVEAVIGDPPRNETRFFEKLRAIGIDPQEQVGFIAVQDRPIARGA